MPQTKEQKRGRPVNEAILMTQHTILLLSIVHSILLLCRRLDLKLFNALQMGVKHLHVVREMVAGGRLTLVSTVLTTIPILLLWGRLLQLK